MVNVANDRDVLDAELPAAQALPATPVPTRELVTGVPLARVLELPSLVGATVYARAELLGAVVTRASLHDLRTSVVDHHVVCVDPARLAGNWTSCHGPGPRGGGRHRPGRHPQRWRRRTRLARGLRGSRPAPSCWCAARAPSSIVTEVLGAVLDQQSSILARVDEAHQILVGIVLAGGGLEDLCERLAGFLGGATMVTTTDGRVLARAGSEADLEAALALDCFDRTGRLVTEREPVGIRDPRAPTPVGPWCGSWRGSSTTDCCRRSSSTGP